MKVILKDTLKEKNISQYKLAQLTGIPSSTINEICNNKRPDGISYSTLDKICDALDCEVSDILKHEKGDTFK